MTRTALLRDLLDNGRDYGSEKLDELAAELDLPVSDVFVMAGRPVPAHLLPPERDPKAMRAFTYSTSYCDHAALAALEDFVLSLASANPPPVSSADVQVTLPGTDRFAELLGGFMRNRGLGVYEVPFVGLSISTVRGMLDGRHHSLQQLKAISGPLGWCFEDLAAVAGETVGDYNVGTMLCPHVGRVFVAAIPLTTHQLGQAAIEADRLSNRDDRGAWRPVNMQISNCRGLADGD